MDELELTEIECDAVLLDDDAWNAKYAPTETAQEPAPEELADHYEWMYTCLARLLPESMQSNEKIWNGTMSALRAADVRSEEQLDAMSSDDLKMANVPLTARHYLVKNRKGGEGPSPQSGLNTPTSDDGRHDGAATTHSQNPSEKSSTSLSAPSTASTLSDSAALQSARSSAQDDAPLLYDASAGGVGGWGGGTCKSTDSGASSSSSMSSSALVYGTKGSLYLSGGGGGKGGGADLHSLARLQDAVERAAATNSQMSSI